MRLGLLKSLLNNEFYSENINLISDNIFTDKDLKSIFKALRELRENVNTDISINELKQYYFETHTFSEAAKQSLNILFDNIANYDMGEGIAKEIIKVLYRQNAYAELANLSIQAASGEYINQDKLASLISSIQSDSYNNIENKFQHTETELEDILAQTNQQFKWKFNFAPLQEMAGGIGEGIFALVAARPNAGKSAFLINSIFNKGGFLEQGATVHLIGNEENIERTILRGYSCYTGITYGEMLNDKAKRAEVSERIKDIRKQVKFLKVEDMTIGELEKYADLYKPDILLVDQLDKIKLDNGASDKMDLVMREIYTRARNISTKHKLALIGVCQASADAEGRLYYGYDCLEHSKTGKAAETDFIFTIGCRNSENQEEARQINIVKNKLTGIHDKVVFFLDSKLSRMKV